MDTDGDGRLSPQEIKHATAALKRLDHDGDWTLSTKDLTTRVRNPDDPNGPRPPEVARSRKPAAGP